MLLSVACSYPNHKSYVILKPSVPIRSWFNLKMQKSIFKGPKSTQAPLQSSNHIICFVIYIYTILHQHRIALSLFKYSQSHSPQPLLIISITPFSQTPTQNVLPQHKVPGSLHVANNNCSWHCNGRFIKGQRGMHWAIGRPSNMSALCWGSSTSSNPRLL